MWYTSDCVYNQKEFMVLQRNKQIEEVRPAEGIRDMTTTTTVTAISLPAARISLAGSVVFLVLVAALHFLKPDYDPSWRFISEYAIGDFGWVMMIAFFFWAAGYAGLFAAIRTQVPTISGKIGVWLLLVIAVAIVMAGIFVADPVTATDAERTTHGAIHGIGGMIGINGTPIAAVLVSRSLARNPDWYSARGILKFTAYFTWLTLVLLFGTLAVTLSQNNGIFGPSVIVGWPNRLLAAAFCAWLIAAAWYAIRLRGQRS